MSTTERREDIIRSVLWALSPPSTYRLEEGDGERGRRKGKVARASSLSLSLADSHDWWSWRRLWSSSFLEEERTFPFPKGLVHVVLLRHGFSFQIWAETKRKSLEGEERSVCRLSPFSSLLPNSFLYSFLWERDSKEEKRDRVKEGRRELGIQTPTSHYINLPSCSYLSWNERLAR